jgi:hypothetical protein
VLLEGREHPRPGALGLGLVIDGRVDDAEAVLRRVDLDLGWSLGGLGSLPQSGLGLGLTPFARVRS